MAALLEENTELIPCSGGSTVNFDDALSSFLDDISHTDIKLRVFHELRILALGVMILFASTGISDVRNISANRLNKFVLSTIEYITLSPSAIEGRILKSIIVFILLMFHVIIISVSPLLIVAYMKGKKPHLKTLEMWVIAKRLLVLAPSLVIGKYIGYYLAQLPTNTDLKSYFPQLVLSIIVGGLWACNVISGTMIYNTSSRIRHSDTSQVWIRYYHFEIYISLLPMIISILPEFFNSIFVHNVADTLFGCATIILNIVAAFLIIFQYPFIFPQTNTRFLFFTIASVPLALIPKQIYEGNGKLDFFLYKLYGILLFCFLISRIIGDRLASTFVPRVDERREKQEEEANHDQAHNQIEQIPLSTCGKQKFQVQDLVNILCLLFAFYFMNFMNAVAAQKMPSYAAVPEIIHDKFKISPAIRSSASFGPFQFSNVATIIMGLILLLLQVFFPQYFNVRKGCLIFTLCTIIRAFSIFVTTLPPPCAGLPKCPCSNADAVQRLKDASPFRVALSWTIGFGMFSKYPQCGDLIISGHSIFLWLGMHILLEAIGLRFNRPFSSLISGFLVIMTLIILDYIVITRSHFTIDVVLAALITEMIWYSYTQIQKRLKLEPNASDSFFLKMVKWNETRVVEPEQTEEVVQENIEHPEV